MRYMVVIERGATSWGHTCRIFPDALHLGRPGRKRCA